MTTTVPRLARAIATRASGGIELAFQDEEGETFKVLASDDQADILAEHIDTLLAEDHQSETNTA